MIQKVFKVVWRDIMAGDHTKTSNNNIGILKNEIGSKQYRNTTIFTKGRKFILSPSIGNESNWFDIRKVNLDKFTSDYSNGYLIIRFKEKLLVTDLRDFIEKMIDKNKFSDTKNSGVHWQFTVKESLRENDSYKVIGRLSKREICMELVNKEYLIKII